MFKFIWVVVVKGANSVDGASYVPTEGFPDTQHFLEDTGRELVYGGVDEDHLILASAAWRGTSELFKREEEGVFVV